MSANSITSLIRTGTKLWLDSVDPDLIAENLKLGATGATSNPIIISDLVKSGRYDKELARLLQSADSPSDAAWQLNDQVVAEAQRVFEPTWQKTQVDDGYVSFEVDPLLEDPSADMPMADRVKRYVSEGIKWSRGHKNRMIKVPATPAGIAALPELAAQGIPLNVTLIFTQRQYEAGEMQSGKELSEENRSTHSRVSTASSFRGLMCTPRSMCLICRQRRRRASRNSECQAIVAVESSFLGQALDASETRDRVRQYWN